MESPINQAISIGEPWMWAAFIAFVIAMLILDLFVLGGRKAHTVSIFAIKGLRALYFLLADVADRFHLLKYGLAMVLTFIGTKMLIMPWYHVPVQASLAVVAVLIGGSVIASLIATRKPSS
jgi:hypothetical protein